MGKMVGNIENDEQAELEREVRSTWESHRSSFNEWATENGVPLSEFDLIVDGQVEHALVKYQKERADTELEDSSIFPWNHINSQNVDSLQKLLEENPPENKIHHFLEKNPQLLVQVLGGGHGRYCKSKPRLGAEFVPDFLIAEMSSIGIEWQAVEIESVQAKVCRKDGLATEKLNKAIGQIRDWRNWFMNNLDYARRPKENSGLGLVGIEPRIPGLIIIGRRMRYPSRFNEFRRQMISDERIVIHSYDWLVDVARRNSSEGE